MDLISGPATAHWRGRGARLFIHGPSLRTARPALALGKERLATIRLMHVACETGARFVRDRLDDDPLDWLLKPRRLFGGKSAVVACREFEGYRRAVILHGLALDLDAGPDQLRGIPAQGFVRTAALSAQQVPPEDRPHPDGWENGAPALYCSSISSLLDGLHVQIFSAMIARSANEVRLRLRRRYGLLLEDEAQVRLGFDWSEPLACALVSEAMADLLSLAAEDPTSPLAEGLDFQVEQRFAA